MKNLLHYIFSFSLVLILLVSSLQLSIYKMECLMSGNTQISFSEFENCNSKQKSKGSCSINQICCCFHQMDLNFDYDSDFSSKVFISIPAIKTSYVTALPQLNSLEQFYNFYTDLPPPSGYNLLKLVQVFRL